MKKISVCEIKDSHNIYKFLSQIFFREKYFFIRNYTNTIGLIFYFLKLIHFMSILC